MDAQTPTSAAAAQPTVESFFAQLDSDKDFFSSVSDKFLGMEKFQGIISNKADSIYNNRISDEVSNIHKRYDDDMFEVLGERPAKLEGGGKQKTYEKIKEAYVELKDYRDKKITVNKDDAIIALKVEIEELKKGGGGEHWKSTFEAAQSGWKTEKETLMGQITDSHDNILNFKKQADIEAALRDLKYQKAIPESARKARINEVVKELINNSKIEDERVVYLNEDGSRINNSEFKPENSSTILREKLKDILEVENTDAGGGAPASYNGTVERSLNVDGKSVAKLNMNASSFTTQVEFNTAFENAMTENGIPRGTKEWKAIEIDAYSRYQVSKLPLQKT